MAKTAVQKSDEIKSMAQARLWQRFFTSVLKVLAGHSSKKLPLASGLHKHRNETRNALPTVI